MPNYSKTIDVWIYDDNVVWFRWEMLGNLRLAKLALKVSRKLAKLVSEKPNLGVEQVDVARILGTCRLRFISCADSTYVHIILHINA